MTYAIIAMQLAIGVFFLFSGFNKLTNKGRHATLVATLKTDNVPLVSVNQWLIPLGEFFGGMALIIDFLTPLAAVGLIIICIGATALDGIKRVNGWKPINIADRIDDYLYLPEVLYILALAVIGLSAF